VALDHVHARAGGEIVRRLSAAVQHDDQRDQGLPGLVPFRNRS